MSESKKIRWGVMGCGWIAAKFVTALQQLDNAVLQAAGSRNMGKAEEFAKKFGFKASYGSYEELVNDPEVDIIYVATPHSHHYANTLQCLGAGKHVLCEKAFTVNRKQLERLVSIATEKRVFLMEALWTRFLPGMIKAKELIDQGVIGNVVTMDADFGMNFTLDPTHRLFNPWLAGGVLLDIGIYPLFLSLYMFDKPVVIKAHSLLDDNQIDHTTSMITQTAGGTICNLTGTTRTNRPVKAAFYGSKGKLEFDNWWFTPASFTVYVDGEEPQLHQFPPMVNGYEYEAIEAMKCISEGKLQSEKMPLSFSLTLMGLMDEIRSQCGIVYPPALESVEVPYED